MSNFIVRVQFNMETNRKYTLLRDSLLNIGFTKRVTSKEGIEYRLPNGNYRIDSDKDIVTVLNAVKQIAYQIEKSPQIFVTEAKEKGMAWVGLQQV